MASLIENRVCAASLSEFGDGMVRRTKRRAKNGVGERVNRAAMGAASTERVGCFCLPFLIVFLSVFVFYSKWSMFFGR